MTLKCARIKFVNVEAPLDIYIDYERTSEEALAAFNDGLIQLAKPINTYFSKSMSKGRIIESIELLGPDHDRSYSNP